MPRLIALKKISSRYPAGAEFEVNDRTARLLKAIGKAQDAPPPKQPEPARETPRRRVEQPQETVVTSVQEQPEARPARAVQRFYRRRDMRAEDE